MGPTTAVLFFAAVVAGIALPSESTFLEKRSPKTVCNQISPAPAGSSCDVFGDISKPAVLKTIPQSENPNLSEGCDDYCGSNSACVANGYNYDTGVCTLYSKTLKAMKFTADDNSDSEFSARSCLSCSKIVKCEATLKNGGFESGQISPWRVGGDPGVAGSIVSPGSGTSEFALQISIPPAGGGFSTEGDLYQSFGWCSGTNYTISFDYKATGAAIQPLLFFSDDNQDSSNLQIGQGGFSSSYQTATTTVTAGNYRGAADFSIYNEDENNTLDFFIDNVKIVKAA